MTESGNNGGQWKPGDIANGHILGPDNTWRPIGAQPTSPPQAGPQPTSPPSGGQPPARPPMGGQPMGGQPTYAQPTPRPAQRKKWPWILGAVVAAIVIFAAGVGVGVAVKSADDDDSGSNTATEATESSDDAGDEPSEDASEDAGDEPSEDASEDAGEAPDGTASIGDEITVGDWTVVVTDINTNADSVIARANQFNEAPKGTYVLVSFDATYNGDERTADANWDLQWNATTPDQKIHDQGYQVTPADNDNNQNTEVRPGGTVSSDVVFDLKTVDGSIIEVSDTWGEDYADFVI